MTSPSTPTSGDNPPSISGGAATSRFAQAGAGAGAPTSSQPMSKSHSSTSSRPSSPTTFRNTSSSRTSSPSFNRRAHTPSSSSAAAAGGVAPSGGSAASSAHNPHQRSTNPAASSHSLPYSPSTPQRGTTTTPSSNRGTPSRSLTPSSSALFNTASSPSSSSGGGTGNPEAALTSLQELIRTMPSAGDSTTTGSSSPSAARASPVSSTNLPRLRSTTSSSAHAPSHGSASSAAVNNLTSPASASTHPPTISTSTLNPNAGGFQPGALSALGEVEHEVLITPQVATFGPGISSPRHNNNSHHSHQQMPTSPPPSSGLQHAGAPFSPASAGSGNNGNNANVFGSPIQTPQHQIGHNHNPYAISGNTAEWQNFHNVFNAGIGNGGSNAGNGPTSTPPSNNGTQSPMNGGNNNATGGIDYNAILASMAGAGGFMDFSSMLGGNAVNAQQQQQQAMLAAAALAAQGGTNTGMMNPLQAAQFGMLQQLQAQAGVNTGFGNSTNAQQQAQQQALLQAQQMQLAQLMLQAQMQSQSGGQAGQAQSAAVPPRFNTSSVSQPDLASLATASPLTAQPGNGAGAGQGSPFIAEQLALQAQYEALRQQQQELMNRFQEMQLQAVQLAQAQQQAHSSPQQQNAYAHVSSPGMGNATQQQHAAAGISSPLAGQAQLHQHGHGHAREASNAPHQQQQGGPPNARQQPHRRGPSQSISGMASSGPMGQFGSMGQFALPSAGLAGPGNNTSGAGGLPKGHGRRHSVNVSRKNENNNNNIMAFSFPAGSANPTQGGTNVQGGQGGPQVAEQLGGQEDGETVPGQARAARAYGHGRRESRGSIGSLAGWGSNSNVVTQSSVPITQPTVTDLAQAQAQLLQLSQYRASAGHSRLPSFGLQQLQSGPGGGNNNQQRKSLFAPYLPAASIPPLLQTGKLVIGVLRVNKRNRSDAYVATDVLDADVFICGSKDRNRALEGDVVAVELLDVDEVWGTKKEKEEKKRKKEESTSFDPKFQQQLRKQDKKRDDVEVEGQGLTLFDDEEVNDDQKPTYAGHVIAVVERQAGQLFAGTLGILRPSSAATKEKQDAERRERDGIDIRGGDEQKNRPKIVWFKPVDKRVPLVAIPADQAPSGFLDRPDDYVNTLFVACIKRWPITSLHPFGSLVEELGEIGNLEAESNALLKDCGFTDETFSDNVAKCLPPTPWTIPQTEIDARKDFRQCRVFTIDPDTARDLDDALHINKLDDGTFEVGVHIADVSHFVKPNTAIDREARRRGTTVYLVQRASPMLPEQLSSNLCSLQPGEDRLAFSSVFKMSPDGRVLSSWFGKSVIKSAAKLSYNMAQQAIDQGKLPEDLTIHDDHDMEGIVEDIKQLDEMAKQMRARRFENGALRIDNVKLSFALDEDGRPIDCVVYERKDSHSLIEEFMLTANQAVAQKIASALPEQALLRRHEMPIARRLEGFTKRAGKLGYDFDITSAGSLMKSFKALSKEDPELVLRLLATKAMLRAQYICSGMFDIAKYHHYALNIPIYTHFTSPIRRYADVIVHRQLEAALTENPEGRFLMDPEAVSKVAQHCNTKKAAAKLAQEASQHLYLCTMISDLTQKYGPVMRQATVIGVLDQAFDVVVSEFGIEKRVHADQMPIENHVYDERSNTLQLYWKKGVDVIKFLAEKGGDPHLQRVKETAEQHARLMESSTQSAQAEEALFEDDEQEEGQVPEVTPITSKSAQQAKSTKKHAPVFEGIEETSAGHCVQTVKELQTVPVIISSDLTVSPPVIKCFAVNPFP